MAALSEWSELDTSKVAYQLTQPTGMMPDIFLGGALDLDANERDWVPQSADVSFKPLVLSVSQGYYVNILRVRSSGVLSRHRHTGPVHAFTLRGRWHYLSSTTGSPRPATTLSSPRARPTPSLCPKTCRKWPRCFTSRAGTPT